MLDLAIFLVVVLSSIWVYYDATSNKIGKIKGIKGMFNMSAGGWCLVTLLLWIVGFPSYLIKRKALTTIANENPIEYSAAKKSIAFFLLSLILVAGAFLFYSNMPTGASNVAMIKRSTIGACPHTVEKMAEHAFSTYTWGSGNSEGQDYVNLEGTFIDNKSVKVNLQFIISPDGKSFHTNALALNGKLQNQATILELISVMCITAESKQTTEQSSRPSVPQNQAVTKSSPDGNWAGKNSRMNILHLEDDVYSVEFFTATESGCTGDIDGYARLSGNTLILAETDEHTKERCVVEITINNDNASVSSDNCAAYAGVACGIYGELKRAD